eukprot:scaffold24.g2932.t1
MADVEGGAVDLSKALADSGPAGVVEALKRLPVALVGKTTCAYSLEAQATLAGAAAPIGGAAAVETFWLDKLPAGAAVHGALKKELSQSTVPYVFVGGEFLGGCDDVKKLAAAGQLAPRVYAAAGGGTAPTPPAAAGGGPADGPRGGARPAGSGAAAQAAGAHASPLPDARYVDPHAAPAVGDAAPPAPPTLFFFPEVVDANVIRLTAAEVVVVCILCIVFRTHAWAHWTTLGLALDNLARFAYGAGPSPLAQLARCGAALLAPSFRPGVPKQFASLCATFMATVATVFMFTQGFDPEEIIPSVFLGMYAGLAAMEAAFDFCMGCVMFGWIVKFGLLPPEVYSIGISAKPEAEYTYAEAIKRLDLPEPQQVCIGYPGKPPSKVDGRYKAKTNDADRQSFHPVKHVKMMQFNAALGLCGLAALWRAAAAPALGGAAGLAISHSVGDALAIIAVAFYGVLTLMYCAKAFLYPNKLRKEWFCPLRSNTFVIPPAALVLIAYCAAGRFAGSLTLAKARPTDAGDDVLYWIGAPLALAIALYLAARWITDPHSPEHLNPAWLLPPTACLVCALVGPLLDARYGEACFLWYGAGVATGLPVYVISFQRGGRRVYALWLLALRIANAALLFNEPDDRNRLLKWSWVALPAVACAALAVLSAEIDGAVAAAAAAAAPFGFASRLLYMLSLSLAMVLGLLFLTGHTSRLRFDVASWALAFPLEALAIATLLYAAAIPGSMTMGMAVAGLATASVAVLVLALHTIQSLLMGGVFVMDPKYGPLSQQILTHEAFRAAGERLKAAAAALGPSGKGSAAALADFALQFRRYRLAHAWHAQHEESVIFKEFETYVPGLCGRQHGEHAEDEAKMERWGGLLEAAEAGGKGADEASAVLAEEVPAFVDGFEAHLVGEEEHLQRGGRKHMNLDLQRSMLRRMWEETPPAVWAEFLPWVVANLPMQQQRVKFVRCWAVWALPERAQLIGRMIALGVDGPTWERLVAAVPEVAPRGAAHWRKYF